MSGGAEPHVGVSVVICDSSAPAAQLASIDRQVHGLDPGPIAADHIGPKELRVVGFSGELQDICTLDASGRPGSSCARNVGATPTRGDLRLFVGADETFRPGVTHSRDLPQLDRIHRGHGMLRRFVHNVARSPRGVVRIALLACDEAERVRLANPLGFRWAPVRGSTQY